MFQQEKLQFIINAVQNNVESTFMHQAKLTDYFQCKDHPNIVYSPKIDTPQPKLCYCALPIALKM